MTERFSSLFHRSSIRLSQKNQKDRVLADVSPAQISRILVIMMGGIGDMILLIPALKALRKAYPSSTLSFLLGPYGAEKVIEGSDLINHGKRDSIRFSKTVLILL